MHVEACCPTWLGARYRSTILYSQWFQAPRTWNGAFSETARYFLIKSTLIQRHRKLPEGPLSSRLYVCDREGIPFRCRIVKLVLDTRDMFPELEYLLRRCKCFRTQQR